MAETHTAQSGISDELFASVSTAFTNDTPLLWIEGMLRVALRLHVGCIELRPQTGSAIIDVLIVGDHNVTTHLAVMPGHRASFDHLFQTVQAMRSAGHLTSVSF